MFLLKAIYSELFFDTINPRFSFGIRDKHQLVKFS